MKRILEYFFQNSVVFPLAPEDERQFAKLGEEVEQKREQLKSSLKDDTLHQVEDYLESLEDLHDWERRLAFNDGFLLATALWLEVSDKLGRLKL